jgi:hypothetical protein
VGANSSRGLIFGSLALIALGVVLLLNNFLYFTSFSVNALLPLILVVVGAVILIRGDLLGGSSARPFGITRGSVEAGILEISAGAVDVKVRAMEREGRLIAGSFAHDARPQLVVSDNRAHLLFARSATPWHAFNDWSLELARDLPWSVYASTSIGRVQADLTGLIISDATLATGFGSIRLVCPQEAFQPLTVRSTLGNIQILTPHGIHTRIIVKGPRSFSTRFDPARYARGEDGAYESLEAERNAVPVIVNVCGTFGDLFLG